MRTINVAIIGCGGVTEKKSGPAFQKLPGSNLYAVMRRNEKLLIDYATRHGVERYTTNYLDLLTDDSVDAVYIATPPYQHKFYTLEAAKHGKAVYLEKPMGMTVAECREMMAVCSEYDVPLFVAYYRREHDKFIWIRKLLESNGLGKVRSFTYQFSTPLRTQTNPAWLLDKELSGGGLLYDIGSHMIDIILYLFGDVQAAAGMSSNQSQVKDVNDNTSGMMTFTNGVQGVLQFTFNGSRRLDEMTIEGDKGTLVFPIMSNDPVTLFTADQTEQFSFAEIEHVQLPLIKRVIDTLRGEDDLEATGISGLRTQEILEAFDKSETLLY